MSSFTPLVFFTAGGFGPAALITFKRIALRLTTTWTMPYSAIMDRLKCRTLAVSNHVSADRVSMYVEGSVA